MNGRSNWLVIAAFGLVAAANQMLWLTFAAITTDAAHHYDVSVGTIGWLSEIFPLLYVVLAIPAGLALDRRFRLALGTGAVLTAAGGVLRLGGDAFAWIMVGQLLVAVAQPLVLNAVSKLALDHLPEGQRPLGIALGSAGIFLGMVLALALGPAVSAGGHFGLLLAVQAVFAVVAAAGLLVALRARPRRAEHRVAAIEHDALRVVWRDRTVRRLAALSFLGFGVFVALTTWLQALLDPSGVSEATAGGLLAAMIVAGVVGSALLPAPVARRGEERNFLRAAAATTAAGCLIIGLVPVLGVRAGALVVMGAVLLTALPVILEATEQRTEAAPSTAAALIWMAGNVGGLAVALAVQALVHHPLAAFLVMAATIAIGVPVASKLPRSPMWLASFRRPNGT